MVSRALAIRPAIESDQVFIADSWCSSFRTAHAAGLILMDDWRAVMGRTIGRLLARPGVRTLVAAHPGAAEGADIYGWIAVDTTEQPPLVLYAYVKGPYRRMGIATRLLEAAGLDRGGRWEYACRTGVVATHGRTKIPRARWNPLRARYHETTPEARDHATSES